MTSSYSSDVVSEAIYITPSIDDATLTIVKRAVDEADRSCDEEGEDKEALQCFVLLACALTLPEIMRKKKTNEKGSIKIRFLLNLCTLHPLSFQGRG